MKRTTFALMFFALAAVAAVSRAIEVPAFHPDPALKPARIASAVPLRVAEALALDAFATLAPAREGAAADLAAMAAWNSNGGLPTRVGFARALPAPLALRYETASFEAGLGRRVGGGVLSRAANGDWVWGTSVEIGEAKALRIELAEVDLPAGTRLWVYGAGGVEARSFDLRILRSDRSLLSPTISGERIYLEVELPAGAVGSGAGFVVRRAFEVALSDDAKPVDAALANPESDECLQNGECFDATDFPGIAAARAGVFRFIGAEGSSLFTCSGGLLSDTDDSTLEPWLLTAHHCVDSQDVALSMDMRFFWRFSSCGSSTSTYTLGPLGADLIVTSATSDVTLVRALDASEIPAGATYLGWSSTRPSDGTVLYRLSHPVLASGSTQPQMYSTHVLDETPAINCFATGAPLANFLYSINLADTGISGGSSGSPILRSDAVVVGQLNGTCGVLPTRDGCGTDESIVDGAFATSYPLLQPYLAPTGGQVCVRDATTACLLNGKFKVQVTYQTATASGPAQIMSFGGQRAENVESAFFWFFNATNFEMGVKMVDACVEPFNRSWVFFSGLTSQGFQVTVTRMSDLVQKVYPANPVNHIPTTTADTDAFTCPPAL
ncbi:MAG: trypsin-like peptidase domain-containing protein [Thermoanaerobaculia bacterium]